MPIIGNGDVLSYYEAQRRMQDAGCLAVMVGRGALIKPWIFKEMREVRFGVQVLCVGLWG